MTVFNSNSYQSAIVFSQEEFAALQKMVTALWEESKYVEDVVDGEFVERLHAALEGEGITPGL